MVWDDLWENDYDPRDGGPLVDIMNGPGIWAAPDGGCNSTVFRTERRENAQQKLEEAGYSMRLAHRRHSQYSGLGDSSKQIAKWGRPQALERRLTNGFIERHANRVFGKSPMLCGTNCMKYCRLVVDYDKGKM